MDGFTQLLNPAYEFTIRTHYNNHAYDYTFSLSKVKDGAEFEIDQMQSIMVEWIQDWLVSIYSETNDQWFFTLPVTEFVIFKINDMNTHSIIYQFGTTMGNTAIVKEFEAVLNSEVKEYIQSTANDQKEEYDVDMDENLSHLL